MMLDQLKLLIRSGHSLLAMETHDETRAVELIRTLARELSLPLAEWSITNGLITYLPVAGEVLVKEAKAAAALDFIRFRGDLRELFVFKDLGPHGKDPLVQRLLRELRNRTHSHIFLIESTNLPEHLRRLALMVRLPLPDAAELEQVVRDTFRRIRDESLSDVTSTITRGDLERFVHNLRGLTCEEAARVVSSAILDDNVLDADDLSRIVEAKRNLLQNIGCLESISADVSSGELGGLTNLKAWLLKRRGGMSAQARAFGIDPPRGMLLLGVQGCGKSLCAKVVASEWGLPLLRLDPGVLYQKFIGESEQRLREAMAQAESMAPVVLWIDEIEKAFASSSSDSSDGGLSQRMFGTLLSWMQDHRSPIFMVATANNIDALPPELMRKGRFDEVFFVDLPDHASRREILAIHLARRRRDPHRFQLDQLATQTEGYSGAELEQLVNSALYTAFSRQSELTDEHLLEEIGVTSPLSILMEERIRELRAWARGRCVPAN